MGSIIFLINWVMICFTIVAFGEHYVVDLLAGWLYALVSFWVVSSFQKNILSEKAKRA